MMWFIYYALTSNQRFADFMLGSNLTDVDIAMTESKKFNIYEKSGGRYLGHAAFTASSTEDFNVEDLNFVPYSTSSLKVQEEEYVEKLEESSFYSKIERDSFLSDEDEEISDDINVTKERGGILSMPMSTTPQVFTSKQSENNFETGRMSRKSLGNYERFYQIVEDQGSQKSKVRCLVCLMASVDIVLSRGNIGRHMRNTHVTSAASSRRSRNKTKTQ